MTSFQSNWIFATIVAVFALEQEKQNQIKRVALFTWSSLPAISKALWSAKMNLTKPLKNKDSQMKKNLCHVYKNIRWNRYASAHKHEALSLVQSMVRV